MFSAIFTLAALSLAAFAKDVTINTPQSVTQCKEVTITWQDGKAPYTVSVVPGDDPCEEALVEFPSTSNTWFHWQAPNLNAGTKVIFSIEDATGDEAWSGEVTIQKGTTTSCNATVSSSSGSAAGTPAAATGTTLDVPAIATATATPTGTASGTDNSPVVNPGGSISAAPSSKGGFMAVGAGLVAFVSVAFAL